tara:strand:- start:503 stop:649 length:147 start_codon:yes stop_codon:yes gene_type:complete
MDSPKTKEEELIEYIQTLKVINVKQIAEVMQYSEEYVKSLLFRIKQRK